MTSVPPCVSNIGPRERRRRVVVALIALGLSAALAAMLLLTGAPRAWRGVLFFPLWFAAIGLLQAREHT